MEPTENTLQVKNRVFDLFMEFITRSFKPILPQCNTYLIQKFHELPSYRTSENFDIAQFELKAYVNTDSEEEAREWITAFQSWSKTTMPQTRGFVVTGNRVLFREQRHCIHSAEVKKKQGHRETKHSQSARARNTGCTVTIHVRLERARLSDTHPLEIELHFTHNHVINSAESLSFRRVQDDVREEFISLFKDGYSPSSALHTYEDKLHLSASNEQELLEILADRTINPGYDYVAKLFQQYREAALGSSNGKLMFERLTEIVKDYNSSGQGKAILQEYDAHAGKHLFCVS